jgi:hypothetical protein
VTAPASSPAPLLQAPGAQTAWTAVPVSTEEFHTYLECAYPRLLKIARHWFVRTPFAAEDVVSEAVVDILSDGNYRKYKDPQHAFRSLVAAMGYRRRREYKRRGLAVYREHRSATAYDDEGGSYGDHTQHAPDLAGDSFRYRDRIGMPGRPDACAGYCRQHDMETRLALAVDVQRARYECPRPSGDCEVCELTGGFHPDRYQLRDYWPDTYALPGRCRPTRKRHQAAKAASNEKFERRYLAGAVDAFTKGRRRTFVVRRIVTTVGAEAEVRRQPPFSNRGTCGAISTRAAVVPPAFFARQKVTRTEEGGNHDRDHRRDRPERPQCQVDQRRRSSEAAYVE